MKNFVLFIVLTVLPLQTWADSPKVYYKDKFEIMVNGKEYKFKPFCGAFDLGNEMASNQQAFEYYQKYRQMAGLSSILGLSAFAWAVGYSTTTKSWDNGTFWPIFLVPFIASGYFRGRSDKYFLKAINIYNGVAPEQTQNYKPKKQNDNGFQLAFGFTF